MFIDQKNQINHLNAVLIGDLTDAKNIDEMGSKQILEEWQYYKYVIDETNIKEKTLWLDVRGNHGEKNAFQL